MEVSVLLLVGLAVLVTLLTSLFKNVNWNPRVKNLVATVVSVVAAGATLFLKKDGIDALADADLMELSLQVYGASQLFYHFILRGTPVEERLAETEVLPG